MNVGQLKYLIAEMDDDLEVVVPRPDHERTCDPIASALIEGVEVGKLEPGILRSMDALVIR